MPQLGIGPVSKHGQIARVMVTNTGGSVARGCYGKVTISHLGIDDIVNVGVPTIITSNPREFMQIEQMNVTWAYKGGTSASMNIPRGGAEPLMIAKLDTKSIPLRGGQFESTTYLEIPSDDGFAVVRQLDTPHAISSEVVSMSRATVKVRKYEGKLTVGAEDILPKDTSFVLLVQDDDIFLQLGS